jgi:hypothetical protein
MPFLAEILVTPVLPRVFFCRIADRVRKQRPHTVPAIGINACTKATCVSHALTSNIDRSGDVPAAGTAADFRLSTF